MGRRGVISRAYLGEIDRAVPLHRRRAAWDVC